MVARCRSCFSKHMGCNCTKDMHNKDHMVLLQFWQRVDRYLDSIVFHRSLDVIVHEGSHLEEMIDQLKSVLRADNELAQPDLFVFKGMALIQKGLCTIYGALFQQTYGVLTSGNFANASLLTHSNDSEYAFSVRVWDANRAAWVIEFDAGYYGMEAGETQTLEFRVHEIEIPTEKFATFRDMICRLCTFIDNRSLVEIIRKHSE
jgi:hypothetical protein